jgi:hypothetical protein
MSDNSASIVSKVWNYAHVLKNAGIGYGHYSEQHRIDAKGEARTTAIDQLKAELDRQISRNSRLRLGILTSAFSGEGTFV